MDGFLVDLHCHTAEKSYDGHTPAAEVVSRLVELGFHGLVLTDHGRTWQRDELEQVRRDANAPGSFLLLAGQEVRCVREDGTTVGDLLVYGPQEDLGDNLDPRVVLDAVGRARGFAIAAHVGAPRVGFGDAVADYPVPAAEVWNGRYGPQVAERGSRLAAEHGLVATGGSDAHRMEQVGGGGTLLPRPAADLDAIRAMVLAGECEPWRPRVAPASKGRLRRLFGL